MSALVTPRNLRSALAVTRSLGRDDLPPAVVDDLSESVRKSLRGAVERLRASSQHE